MTIYQTYFLSETSPNIRPCNNYTINFYPTCTENVYTCVLCYKTLRLVGTATLSNTPINTSTITNVNILTIQFVCTTNATVTLNNDGTQGTLTIIQPAWQNPITIKNLFMNSLLTYP
jgi:hypothetical protein